MGALRIVVDVIETNAIVTLRAENEKVRTENEKLRSELNKYQSPYLLFSMEYRKRIVADPHITLGEMAKRCAAAWALLDQDAKQIWYEKIRE
tara:strand:- start:886 stop:1161 length:276 start_codon:yes stop_codon:yes gene_type:complete